jgi:hypothetical protein
VKRIQSEGAATQADETVTVANSSARRNVKQRFIVSLLS